MEINKELELGWDFVNKSQRNIFLTGKAGTGKTTFLHTLKQNSLKRMVIVAPTGVAAINAKGVTIHSFFQLPFGPILPDDTFSASNGFKNKFSKTKINIIKSLDLLVIDEISMVRADLLDAIDKILRRYKDRNQVFGGLQVLMIGDLQQLSPVVRDNEWELLKPFYNNPYFFSSHAYQYCNPITVELKNIYRQDNPKFIEILNEIRSNNLSEKSVEELNKRLNPNFSPSENEGYIFLTTHNRKADQVNQSELDKLSSKTVSYSAKVQGKFPEFSYPNEDKLVLKVGAQVMFIRNDSSPEKRYFNGKIGKVIHLDKDEVVVKCPDDDFTIITKPETWENITYKVDKETDAIKEDKIGSYTQMPLRLAWSITIHKSQGLTFEKAVIDAEGAFAHGQTYVALSRCKSLEGLVLKSKINSRHIISDTNVLNFTKQAEENQPDEKELEQSKSIFQLQLISEVFDFFQFIYPVNRVLDIYYKNRGSIEGNLEQPLTSIKDCATNLLKVANSFKVQLKELAQDKLPENDQVIQERFKKAINYFSEETKSKIMDAYQNFSFSTDNKALDKDISKQLDTIEELIATKKLYFSELKDGFEVITFLGLRAKSVFLTKDKPKKLRKKVIDGTTNIELFELLRELRNTLAQEHDLIHYQIFTQKALYEMCETLPTTKKELLQVNGFGKVRVEKYGNDILTVIREYCEENDIDTSDDTQFEFVEENKPKRKKGDTQKESLALFKDGKTIEEIAHLRDLNENTIFGHLAKFIKSGDIKISDLMPKTHYQELKELIPKHTFDTLSDLKHQLDDKYSYGEIRLVLDELSS
ncbi:DNA repair and recombination protein, putative helicase [Mesoflavibacter sp. HG96]|uniref:helix-turn-helix domain-containing protein n=1 Tax=unclassified Mesoflavibacter TaxID=2630131 RepID=UPI000D0FFAF0|nr:MULTISPECIES: helix-turn-helix domain-containing protein [unclassified Mesoflavibacter]QIJ88206.1 DNA repair and recombination protein, putative helicase [Mesoflavibacter sp. HG96]QIJ90934.1 DNA repair and recombination protein, putative helicase [Mesoflavibacter sp. HG37]